MTDYKTGATHQINQWLWSILKDFQYADGEYAFAAYRTGGSLDGRTPFIPAQQQAEFTNIAGGAPMVVYNYLMTPGPEFYRKNEQGAYAIYDNNIARLRATHFRMVDLICREDYTAADVNRWLPANSPWDFKYVSLDSATGPDEFVQEGGRQGATITFHCEYTRDLDFSGLRA